MYISIFYVFYKYQLHCTCRYSSHLLGVLGMYTWEVSSPMDLRDELAEDLFTTWASRTVKTFGTATGCNWQIGCTTRKSLKVYKSLKVMLC